MALFFHSIASLAMAEFACVSLIFTSFTDVPSSEHQVIENVGISEKKNEEESLLVPSGGSRK